jgi:hypothetical protein
VRDLVHHRARAAWAVLKGVAPYALIELLLPGGSILAILCWLYRRTGRSGFLRTPALGRR